tara:strand:- start:2448 stop:3197 length:750 start_codon:yes stop_codon:yes gene_type:complete
MLKHCSLLIILLLNLTSCDVLDKAASNAANHLMNEGSSDAKSSLTNAEVISGLREALYIGIQNAISIVSVTDGFLSNNDIRLPFPSDARKVKEKALDLGLGNQVQKFEITLNRAAEEACKEALPIFKDVIKEMTLNDGFKILNGGSGAATKYLKEQTNDRLINAFTPKVKFAISKVKLTDYWNPLINKYNTAMMLTGGEKINPDLDVFVTRKAVEGLFLMVEAEENKIRIDPLARVTDLLNKVFGSLTN